MTKKFLLLVGCLTICLLTNLSLRVPTTAQAQANCVTGFGPAFVLGSNAPGTNIPQLFFLGSGATTGIGFTTQSPGASFSPIVAQPGVPFAGFTGTTLLGFTATGANATSTALSCLDSFWDINFTLSATGATAGDVIRIFLQQPGGGGVITLAQFQVNAGGTGVTVTGLLAGVDLSANGHAPGTVGTAIPFSIAGRTDLITLALPMNGTIPNCNQLGISVVRGAGAGSETVSLVNLVVTRVGATTQGTSVQGTAGTFATGLPCAVSCPACPAVGADTLGPCDRVICFQDMAYWCQNLQFFPSRYKNFMVVIPGLNFNQPVMVYNAGIPQTINQQVSLALGCGGFMRIDLTSRLTAAYVSTQLSFQDQVPFWWSQVARQQLGCHLRMGMPGMPAPTVLPVTLSTGVTLTQTSTFQDLFAATLRAVNTGNLADQALLLPIYNQLNNCRRD